MLNSMNLLTKLTSRVGSWNLNIRCLVRTWAFMTFFLTCESRFLSWVAQRAKQTGIWAALLDQHRAGMPPAWGHWSESSVSNLPSLRQVLLPICSISLFWTISSLWPWLKSCLRWLSNVIGQCGLPWQFCHNPDSGGNRKEWEMWSLSLYESLQVFLL